MSMMSEKQVRLLLKAAEEDERPFAGWKEKA